MFVPKMNDKPPMRRSPYCWVCGEQDIDPIAHNCFKSPFSAKGVNLGTLSANPAHQHPEVETPKQYVEKTPRILPLLQKSDEFFAMAKRHRANAAARIEDALSCERVAMKAMAEARAILAE